MGEHVSQDLVAYRTILRGLKNPTPDIVEAAITFAAASSDLGQSYLAVPLLEPLATPSCKIPALWHVLGMAYRDEQNMQGALAALGHAADLVPNNGDVATAYARVLFETGHNASEAFAIARALSPRSPSLILSSAAALSAQRQQDAAEDMLLDILNVEPRWLDGHKTLASIRVASGQRDSFDASFKDAIAACPDYLSLRLAHIHLLSTARDWEGARAAWQDANRDFGPQKGLELTRVHIASESGDPAGDDAALFDHLSDVVDPGLDLCRVRQALRLGDPARAAAIGQTHIGRATATMFWPYMSLAWRLLGDRRAAWLDSPPIMEFDLGLTPQELSTLSGCLHALHTAQAPFLEQSVHGGTQTSGQLFFLPLQPIQHMRAKIVEAVETYIQALATHDEGHPLLSPPRDGPILFEGSWSVRLKGGGHHSTHTHPKGWISSALYVDVPPPEQIGARPAGWISFGQGPPELGLAVKPYFDVEPTPGKLVLFPSTMWHRTVPFDSGERLTIAFDVRLPKRRLIP